MNAPHPAPLKRVTLTLARSKELPQGSSQYGYEFIAPIGADGRIDLLSWKAARADCTVRRFAADEDEETGMLVHKPGGAEHARWVFDYDTKQESDDEAGFLFGQHRFAPGEYVSIEGHDGKIHTYTVSSIRSVT